MSALETLLLTKSDRDYIGLKLSEKIAFLIGSSVDERMQIFSTAKMIYNKRSELVHKGNHEIDANDLATAIKLHRQTVIRLIEMTADYTQIAQKSSGDQPDGVDDFINKLRFTVNK